MKPPRSASTLARRLAFPLLMGIALLLRLNPGAGLSLGVDDGVSLLNAAPPVGSIMRAMLNEHEVHPPLYFYFLHVWEASFSREAFTRGGVEWTFRLSSLPWALLVIYLTWRLGAALGGRRVGFAAASLVAVSGYLSYYALEIRMYPMLTVLVLAAAWAAWERQPWALAACCIVAFFTQYLALFFILGLAIFTLSDWGPRGFIWPALAIAIAVGWWVPTVLQQAAGQMFTMRSAPSWPQALELLFQLGFGVTWPVPLPGWMSPGSISAASWLGLLTLLLVVWGWVRTEVRARRFLLYTILVPALSIFAVSNLTSVHVFEYKYFQPLAPFAFIALGFLALPSSGGSGRRYVVRLSLIAAIVMANLASWVLFVRAPEWYGPQDWRDVIADTAPQLRPGDYIMIHPSMMAAPVLIYAYFGHSALFQPDGRLLVIPVDSAQDSPFVSTLQKAKRVWFWTTAAHPFVRQQRLMQHLPPGWHARFVRETASYWPANRIQIFLLDRSTSSP